MVVQIIGWIALGFGIIQWVASWIIAFMDKGYDRIYKSEMMALAYFLIAVLALK